MIHPANLAAILSGVPNTGIRVHVLGPCIYDIGGSEREGPRAGPASRHIAAEALDTCSFTSYCQRNPELLRNSDWLATILFTCYCTSNAQRELSPQ